MKVLRRKDHVLLQDSNGGEYHFTLEEYKKLGKKKAVEKATLEIEKKASTSGFCEYDIRDFRTWDILTQY